MRSRKAKAGEIIYQIKVSLNGWPEKETGPLHRTVAIGSEASAYDLAEIINEAFDFDFDHSFGFYDNISDWTHAKVGYELFADMGEESRYKGVEKTRVGEIFKIRDEWLFLFDYGDEWQFVVKSLAVDSPDKTTKYPQIIESIGEAPPQYPGIEDEEY